RRAEDGARQGRRADGIGVGEVRRRRRPGHPQGLPLEIIGSGGENHLTPAPSLMRRFLDRLYAASGILAAICLAGIFVVMMAASLSRVINLPIQGADDVTAWLCAACAFLAVGHTFRHGELVRV